ncbi:MAG TPA: phosphopantetheine-binding protein [Thermoleophilaceae bacterium]
MQQAERGDVTLDQAIEAVDRVVARSRAEPVRVTAETTLEDLDLTSVDVAEIVVALEEMLDADLDTESAGEILSVGDLTGLRRVGS